MTIRRTDTVAVAALLLATLATGQRRPQPQGSQRPVEIGLNELFGMCRPENDTPVDPRVLYQTLGVVRRTAELDAQDMFALVHPVASCCANGIAVGFVVRGKSFDELENHVQVTVQGRLRVAERPPPLPRGRLAQIELGVLRKHVEIVPSAIEVYDPLTDPSLLNVADRLEGPGFATFARAVRAVGWDETLRQPSYFTVFAPTEHAFAQMPEAERRALFAPDNVDRLEALVRRHIIARRRTKLELMSQRHLSTLGHDAIPIEVRNGSLRIGGARVLFQDASAKNGIVMSLDRLLPE